MKNIVFWLYLVLLLSYATLGMTARADAQENRVEYKTTALLKGNPDSLLAIPELTYRMQIGAGSIAMTARPLISITHFRPSLIFDILPFEFLKLSMGYARGIYFDSLYAYRGSDVDWSDSARGRTQGKSGTADFLEFSLQLKFRFERFVARNNFKLSHGTYQTDARNGFVYEELLDILVPKNGWFFSNEFDLLYLQGPKWVIGMRYTLSNAFTKMSLEGIKHRIGPIASHVFFTERGGTIDSFSAFILLNWYIRHPYRTGQMVPHFMPYSAVGFSMTGTLF